MSQYLLSVHHDYGTEFPPLEEMQPVFAAVDRFNQKLQSEGAWVFAGGLTRSRARASPTACRRQTTSPSGSPRC